MSHNLLVLMSSARMSLALTANLQAYFVQHRPSVDLEQSRALRFAHQGDAERALTAIKAGMSRYAVGQDRPGEAVYDARGLIALQLLLDEVRSSYSVEILSLDEFMSDGRGGSAQDLDASILSADSPGEALHSAEPLPIAALLPAAIDALKTLREVCGSTLALFPAESSHKRPALLVGMFGAEHFNAAMGALGILELAQPVLFSAISDQETDRVRQHLDWILFVEVSAVDAAEPSAVNAARTELAKASLGIPGWDLPITDELLLSAVRDSYFEEAPMTADPALTSKRTG